MYSITDEQITYIRNDIRRNGVEMEELQDYLVDHICCIVEQDLKENDDFEGFYQRTIRRFYRNDLQEIETEAINLVKFKNYYAMRKVMMISGVLSLALLLAGSFFKIMHWPGASLFIVTGMLSLCFVFVPLILLLKVKEPIPGSRKLTYVTGGLGGILYALSCLFMIMHWPGAMAMLYSSMIMLALIFSPLYLVNGLKDPETKYGAMLTSILVTASVCVQFTLVRVRPIIPSQVYTYLKSEQLLKDMQQGSHTMPAGSPAAAINAYCQQLKEIIVKHDINMKEIPADFEARKLVIAEHNVDLPPTAIVNNLLAELKKSVTEYNASVSNGSKVPTEHSVADMTLDEVNITSNFFVLNDLVRIQLYVTAPHQPQPTASNTENAAPKDVSTL